MITAIIIDDEQKGRSALRQKLKQYCPGVHVLGEGSSGTEGIQLIASLKPKIVFLDIEMPGMNGFEMLNHIGAHSCQIIFTTAYDQYAIKAIKYAAFDYLLKPIDIEELKSAVENAEKQLSHHTTEERLETLVQNLAGNAQMQKIAIPTMEGLLFINLTDIVYLKAESNYTIIHCNHQPKIIASRTLGSFEELLPSSTFYRPHHSYLINLNYIKRYIKGDGGQIEMENGEYVDVARRKKEEFIKLMR